jgi:3-dehydroquinate synthase
MTDFPSLCQTFQVNFNYSVHFTTEVFKPENDLLARAATGGDGDLPKLLLIDHGVLKHHRMSCKGKNYCHCPAKIKLARAVNSARGEGVKNNPEYVPIHRAQSRIGRHSTWWRWGRAVIDAAGYARAAPRGYG